MIKLIRPIGNSGGGSNPGGSPLRSSSGSRTQYEQDLLDEIRKMEGRAFNGFVKILNPFNIGVADGLRRARRG